MTDKVARKVVSKYELYHKGLQGKPEGLKAYVPIWYRDGKDYADVIVMWS